MEITYYGGSSFHIKGNKVAVALNPKKGMPNADLSLYSSEELQEKSEFESKQIIDWPGEYEIAEVLVQAVSVSHGEGNTTIFNLEIDEVKVLYLPNLDHILKETVLEKVGNADVLLIPVGGAGVLDAKTANKAYEEIEPKVVIPMQHSEGDYAPVGDFLKEVGQTGLEFENSVKLSKAKLPTDTTEFHVLSQA